MTVAPSDVTHPATAHFHGWSDEPKREEPKNEFLRTETLITGRVLD